MICGFLLTAAIVIVVTFGAAVLLDIQPGGPPTSLYLAINLIGGVLAGVAGGYVCASVAPRTPAGHAIALALLVLALSLPALFSEPLPGQPAWYPAALSVLGPASILLGGWLFVRWARSLAHGRSAVLTVALLALLAPLTGCAARQQTATVPATWAQDEAAIRAAVTASSEAWNRGDLRGHLAIYVDTVTFMTADGPRPGVEALHDAFARSYFSDGTPKQRLRFEQVVVRPLGRDAALQTGRFVLSGGGEPDQTGWFTLAWIRTAEGWRAVHDHSS